MPESLHENPDERSSREAFVRASYEELFRWFLRMSGCREWSADLTQDTFVAFWESLDRRTARVSMRTWLYAVGRNVWRKQVRDRKRPSPTGTEQLLDGLTAPEPESHDGEFRDAVRGVLAELPESQREAFTLRFWHEFRFEQIGAIQGVTAGVARWRFFAARRRLHERLADWSPSGDADPCREENHAR